ncbi:peptide transporter family 1-like [Bacillus rossius redtenbacheri]|uniref:peptide transporter family 1-like n=1 Tax=Bacillus rossius redtenbacheri TaxID=93214 RepID=UPI002FDCEB7F
MFITQFVAVAAVLALYLENALLLPEWLSVTVYHGFTAAGCVAPLLGACLADGVLGRFSAVFATGLALTSAGAAGPKPCAALFLGDQFELPRQARALGRSQSALRLAKSLGAVLAVLLTPAVRTAAPCFGAGDCYLAAFALTTVLFGLAQEQYALWKKFHSKHREKTHWLNYASRKYDSRLIEDMKVMFSIMLVFVPLPIFWSLFDQQGSRWIFQVSRTDCRVPGLCLAPDQLQAVSPAAAVLLVVACGPRRAAGLWGVPAGGLLAGLAFVTAGVVEVTMEVSYSSFPGRGEAYLNVINSLPCRVELGNPFNHFQEVGASSSFVFRNITASGRESHGVMVAATRACGGLTLSTSWAFPDVPVVGGQYSIVLGSSSAASGDSDDATLQRAARPFQGGVDRMVFLNLAEDSSVAVELTNAISSRSERSAPGERHSSTQFVMLDAGRYIYEAKLLGDKNYTDIGSLALQVGEVYTLILQESNSTIMVDLYDLSPLNPPSVLWLLPQYILISVAEVVFVSAGVEFITTQAPRSMATVTLALWYLTVAVGNLIIVAVTYWELTASQAHEFFFFAGLSLVGAVLFARVARKKEFAAADASSSAYLLHPLEDQEHLPKCAPSDFTL